jgi:hypothetical protein
MTYSKFPTFIELIIELSSPMAMAIPNILPAASTPYAYLSVGTGNYRRNQEPLMYCSLETAAMTMSDDDAVFWYASNPFGKPNKGHGAAGAEEMRRELFICVPFGKPQNEMERKGRRRCVGDHRNINW